MQSGAIKISPRLESPVPSNFPRLGKGSLVLQVWDLKRDSWLGHLAMPTKIPRLREKPDGTSDFRTRNLSIPSPTLCQCATLAGQERRYRKRSTNGVTIHDFIGWRNNYLTNFRSWICGQWPWWNRVDFISGDLVSAISCLQNIRTDRIIKWHFYIVPFEFMSWMSM